MSRIDTTIKQKNSDELLINQGFCRSSDLDFFCENSQDRKRQDFAYLLYTGVTLSKENINDFLYQLEYVIQFLSALEESTRNEYFPFYKESIYEHFLEDLTNGLQFLQTLQQEKDLDELEVDIM